MERQLYLIASAIAVLLRVPCSASVDSMDEVVSGDPGSSFDLRCPQSNDKSPVTWIFNNTALANKDKVYQVFDDNSTLRVLKVDRDHVGVYHCSRGENVTEMSFNILVKPYVTL